MQTVYSKPVSYCPRDAISAPSTIELLNYLNSFPGLADLFVNRRWPYVDLGPML
jgi:hypothetical protein